MGKIFKFGCLGIIVLIILGIVVSVMGGGSSTDNKTSTDQKQESSNGKTNKETKKKISLADYESIKTGDSMSGEGGESYEDIVAKFGEPSSKSESQTGDFKMIMASWTKNINGDFGANFNLTFIEKDGAKHVSSKGQMGMK
ncbi:DUF3862 domain-containing protein [Bacillus cereus]|uniref:DUF3862 domain-containing protein n=1 Tax=Bacillus cereus TaxID=1396 RepID=UPI003D168355